MLVNCVRYYAVRGEENLEEFGRIWMFWFSVMQCMVVGGRICIIDAFLLFGAWILFLNCWTSSRIVSLLVCFIYTFQALLSFSTLMFHITSHFGPVFFLSSKFRLKGKELVCEFLGKKGEEG